VRGRPTRKKQTFRSTWEGVAGKWRRRDMTKSRLVYAVYQARGSVRWAAIVPSQTGSRIGRFAPLLRQRTQVSSAPSERTCSEATPPPCP
jgi:hypothetical protein